MFENLLKFFNTETGEYENTYQPDDVLFVLYREDIPNWQSIENDGIPNLIFSDVEIEGYIPFDTIMQIYSVINYVGSLYYKGHYYIADFKFIRDEIKNKFILWDEHSVEEKDIFCELMIGAYPERVLYKGQSLIESLSLKYSEKVKDVRQNRLDYFKIFLYRYLDSYFAKSIINDSKNIFNSYIRGIEGTFKNDPVGIYDFIDSKVSNIYYQGIGIRGRELNFIKNITQDNFCDMLINTTINGIGIEL